MTPRPIYRWRSFWLGILVLGFLGWAWIGSMTIPRGYYWYTGRGNFFVVGQSEGSFLFRKGENVGRATGIGAWHDPHATPSSWFPPAVVWKKDHEGSGTWLLSLSCLAVILLFSVPWSAFLVARFQKQRLLTEMAIGT